MDFKDLHNLSEAWQNITTPEVEQLDETYIEEQGGTGGVRAAQARRQQQQTAQAAATNKKIQAGEKLSVNTAGPVLGALGARTTVQRNQQGNLNVLGGRGGLDKTIRLGGNSYDRLTQGGKVTYVKRQPAAQQNLKGLSIGAGGFNINGKPVQTTPARPATSAAPAAKPAPAATAPAAKPAAAAPAAKPAAAASTATPAAPARRSLAQDLEDLRAMRAASAMRQAGQKINGKIPTGADVQAASKSVSDLNKGARQYMKQDVDLFDIIKGYLLDEGATEEEALKMMAVMTEEERNEIIESSCGGGHSKKKKKKSGY